jgi:SAM-dependent methyltransferase
MMDAPYTSEFFAAHREGARRSAHVVAALVLGWIPAKSVIDVGCGEGTWLAVFRERGVTEIAGVDGDYIERDKLEIPSECFLSHDLMQPLRLARRFDLAVSLEVAEHLPSESADGFVESLVKLAPVVLFSAAAPFQGGTQHVNEQWPAYWAERFQKHGYLPVDCLRRQLWASDDVQWWYAQNTFLYVAEEYLRRNPALLQEYQACPTALPLVHPRRYLEWIEWGLAQSQQLADLSASKPGGEAV